MTYTQALTELANGNKVRRSSIPSVYLFVIDWSPGSWVEKVTCVFDIGDMTPVFGEQLLFRYSYSMQDIAATDWELVS